MSKGETMYTIVQGNARVIDIAHQAKKQGLHLITDGRRTLISPVVYPGWFKIGANIKRRIG